MMLDRAAESDKSGGRSQNTAILLSMSALADDPRIRRMGDYLHAHGWQVIGVGTAGAKSPPPQWRVFEALEPPSDAVHVEEGRMLDLLRSGFVVVLGILPALMASAIAGLVGVALLPIRPAWAKRIQRLSGSLLNPIATFSKLRNYGIIWLSARLPGNAADRELVRQYPVLKVIRGLALQHGRRGVWIANDWLMLPLAAEGAKRCGGAYVYDSHEFATQEFAQHLDWRVFRQPLVRRVEGRYIAGARVITAVSPQISDALRKTYRFSGVAATLRNMPVYERLPFRAAGVAPRVLYHGIVGPDRGLEAAIESLPSWPQGFTLTIRGPGRDAYAKHLADLADRHGVSDRFVIEPPVRTNDLVRAASAHDIGLLALPGHSAHNAFALPNKVFEYLMGGLALCVSDLPAMADLVRDTGAGVLCGDGSARALRQALEGLVPEEVNRMKVRALEAAKRLHFEIDAEPIARLYGNLL
jgi:glycosyltransferase involved in cell wall biosynthesis